MFPQKNDIATQYVLSLLEWMSSVIQNEYKSTSSWKFRWLLWIDKFTKFYSILSLLCFNFQSLSFLQEIEMF